jgi:hypothetical protein
VAQLILHRYDDGAFARPEVNHADGARAKAFCACSNSNSNSSCSANVEGLALLDGFFHWLISSAAWTRAERLRTSSTITPSATAVWSSLMRAETPSFVLKYTQTRGVLPRARLGVPSGKVCFCLHLRPNA